MTHIFNICVMTQRQLQNLKRKYIREGYKMALRESEDWTSSRTNMRNALGSFQMQVEELVKLIDQAEVSFTKANTNDVSVVKDSLDEIGEAVQNVLRWYKMIRSDFSI